MAFFVNRQITKGMHSESEDSAGGQADMLGIDRDMLGTGRDMLGTGVTIRNKPPFPFRRYCLPLSLKKQLCSI